MPTEQAMYPVRDPIFVSEDLGEPISCVASASVILSVIADVAAVLFEVVAQAAPVAAMAQTPSAVTKFRRRAFMWFPFGPGGAICGRP